MEISVTKKYRARSAGNTYNYKTTTAAGITYVPTPPAIISFSDTYTPTITNYLADYYPLYGPHPRFILVTYDEDGRRIYRKDNPTITEDAEGNIDTIAWDLGEGMEDSGYIILYPTA